MPKPFSESERKIIRQRLMDAAGECLAQFGARKTTVDELVKRVNIPKGTFYLLYESKELLFFDIFRRFHDETNKKMLAEIAGMKGNINPLGMTELIFGLFKRIEESFMLKFLIEGDLEMMLRKIPSETAAKYADRDYLGIDLLISSVPGLNPYYSRVSGAALKGVFLSMLHKHEIGEEVFDDALKVMIYGVVILMFSGD